MKHSIKTNLSLYGAVFKPTGEFWNFQLSEWVPNQCLNCFTTDPNIISSSWGKDDPDVIVCKFKPVLADVFKREKTNNEKH